MLFCGIFVFSVEKHKKVGINRPDSCFWLDHKGSQNNSPLPLVQKYTPDVVHTSSGDKYSVLLEKHSTIFCFVCAL